MDKDKCLIKYNRSWIAKLFREPSEGYEHDWAYKNREERRCLRCGLVEIYFGFRTYPVYWEEWRIKTPSSPRRKID
jgi:hypothetical protein